MAESEASVVARIKDTIGLTTRVVIEPPGTVERSQGKARRVIDRRGLRYTPTPRKSEKPLANRR